MRAAEDVDRWAWFRNNYQTAVMPAMGLGTPGKAPLVTDLATYQQWLLTGLPAEAAVGSVQLPRAWPVAVDWELLDDEGNATSYGAVEPVSFGPSVYWGTNATTPLDLTRTIPSVLGAKEVLMGIFVEWSVAGVRSWQIMDVSPRGTFVIPSADWVRVSYIGCEEYDNGGEDPELVFDVIPSRLQCTVRPAEQGERSMASVTHGIIAVAPATDIATTCWLGPRVKEVALDFIMGAAALTAYMFTNAYGQRLAGQAAPTTSISVSSAALGGAPSATAFRNPIQIPAGAFNLLVRTNASVFLLYRWGANL